MASLSPPSMLHSNAQYDMQDLEKTSLDDSSLSIKSGDLDPNYKLTLFNLQYEKIGKRLPPHIAVIPHVNDPHPDVLRDMCEAKYLDLYKEIAELTRKARLQSFSMKQKFEALQEEKELLKWHIANVSKSVKLQEGKLTRTLSHAKRLENEAKSTRTEFETWERELNTLSLEYQKRANQLEQVIEGYHETQDTLENWLSQQSDISFETTQERHKMDLERRSRYRQWKKLACACAMDRKIHIKVDYIKHLNHMIEDSYMLLNSFCKEERDVTEKFDDFP